MKYGAARFCCVVDNIWGGGGFENSMKEDRESIG